MKTNLSGTVAELLTAIALLRDAVRETSEMHAEHSPNGHRHVSNGLPEFDHALREIAVTLGNIKASAELAEIVEDGRDGRGRLPSYGPDVDRVVLGSDAKDFTAWQWAKLAMACLDLAGLDVPSQRKIRELVVGGMVALS